MKSRTHPQSLVLGLLSVGCLLAACAEAGPLAHKHAAPFYALPSTGAWAQYDCINRDAAGKETPGTLRISYVGNVEIAGQVHAWIEIKLTPERKRPETAKLRKLLVSVERYRKTGDLARSVVEAYQPSAPNQPARKMADAQLMSFLHMGLSRPLPLEKQGEEEDLATPSGKWRTQKVQGSVKENGKSITYAAWLCKDAPFGLCQFKVSIEHGNAAAPTEFRGVLVDTGKRAQSELALPPR